ncbi:uncharacterized protein si:zfos-905g2.1, partial [Tachysurus ichikawai]
EQSNRSWTRERPCRPDEREVERRLVSTPCAVPHTETSPPAATKPPEFHPPSGMESARVGETQQNILLEILSYCRFLHAAVQRLEQKIDSLQSQCRNREISQKLTASVGGAQLSRSLSRRLGPSPQAKPPRSPEWLQATENVPPHGVGGKRDKRRRRRAPRASETQQEAARPVKEEEPRDEVVQKNSRMKRWRKQRKRHTAARSDPEEAPGSEDRNDNE